MLESYNRNQLISVGTKMAQDTSLGPTERLVALEDAGYYGTLNNTNLRYGTVVGHSILSATTATPGYYNTRARDIPGFQYAQGAYFWAGDSLKVVRLSESDALAIYKGGIEGHLTLNAVKAEIARHLGK